MALQGALTYQTEELLGTKLRALYQRKKGRDLFDLSEALARIDGLDPDKIITCFARYMAHESLRVTRAEFEENLAGKVTDAVFLGDVPALLTLEGSFDPRAAMERVRDTLIARLPEGSRSRKQTKPR